MKNRFIKAAIALALTTGFMATTLASSTSIKSCDCGFWLSYNSQTHKCNEQGVIGGGVASNPTNCTCTNGGTYNSTTYKCEAKS